MKVYFISGLGANKKAFNFLDLSFCEPVFIEWLPPQPRESLEHYALRLRESLKEEHPIIVGVSFGGMLATEMAKQDPLLKAILISSNKCAPEFPGYLRIWRHFPVYKWVPDRLVKIGGRFSRPVLGPKGKDQKKIFTEILNETNPTFNSWAIDAILGWKNTTVPKNVIHIHGTSDTLLPYRYVKADHVINGGTHFMIMDNGKELSALLKKIILNE